MENYLETQNKLRPPGRANDGKKIVKEYFNTFETGSKCPS